MKTLVSEEKAPGRLLATQLVKGRDSLSIP